MMRNSEYRQNYERGSELVSKHMILAGRPLEESGNMEDDISEGIKCLSRAVELDPDSWPAFWIMGKGYQRLAKHEEAWSAFAKAMEINPNQPEVKREYVVQCFILDKLEEGLESAKDAVKLCPTDAGLQANLALALFLNNKQDEALIEVRQALAWEPNDEITKKLSDYIQQVVDGKRAKPANYLAMFSNDGRFGCG